MSRNLVLKKKLENRLSNRTKNQFFSYKHSGLTELTAQLTKLTRNFCWFGLVQNRKPSFTIITTLFNARKVKKDKAL